MRAAEAVRVKVRIMRFEETRLSGAFVVDLEPYADERGFFARSFCEREFAARGLPTRFPQCNLSRNTRKATLRGMHFQRGPEREAKLVRAVAGAIYDVIVDLRSGSPSFLQWMGVELSGESGRALFVPGGFAHGFLTLTDNADVFYHMSDFFRPEADRGFRWNDPRTSITWPEPPRVISTKDASYPDLDLATLSG
jgi:dTDP-4-dehydrorhamnose 3,5-epimerase